MGGGIWEWKDEGFGAPNCLLIMLSYTGFDLVSQPLKRNELYTADHRVNALLPHLCLSRCRIHVISILYVDEQKNRSSAAVCEDFESDFHVFEMEHCMSHEDQ